MRATLRLAKRLGVAVGAHPGYPDRANFGRVVLAMSPDQVYAEVLAQTRTLSLIARDENVQIRFIKTHGAMYNHAALHRPYADAIATATRDFGAGVVLVGLAGSQLIAAAAALGLPHAREAFADRTYHADGTLRPRSLPGAVIEDNNLALAQCLRIAQHHAATSFEGDVISVHADSLCLHGDTPGAVSRAAFLRRGLLAAGVRLRAFGGRRGDVNVDGD